MKKLCAIIFIFFPLSLLSQELDPHISVHFYPHALSPQDLLQDGPDGEKIDIQGDTFLAWVDLFPGLFFTHETAYILISKERIRVESGEWWPVLNGKTVLYNENDQYALLSPFELESIAGDGFSEERIDIHVYPHELSSQDLLSDGPLERLFRIDDNCLFIWIDLLPGAFFAHPTSYIFVSNSGVRIESGYWWPTLNGRSVLYDQLNKTGILSPFKVTFDGNFLRSKRRKRGSPDG